MRLTRTLRSKVSVGANRREVIGEGWFLRRRRRGGRRKSPRASWTSALASVGRSLALGKTHELRKFVDQIGEGGDFVFDEAGAFLDETSEFGIGWQPARGSGTFARRSRKRESRCAESWMGVSGFLISCAMRRATSCQAASFCARKTSVRSSKTITIAGIGAARTERTDGDGEMQNAACDDGFDFARDDAHAQRTAH